MANQEPYNSKEVHDDDVTKKTFLPVREKNEYVSQVLDLSSADEIFMGQALEQAHAALSLDEVPIGAVVVYDGRVIAAACNRRETDNDPAGHAEFLALKQAAEVLGVWRLTGCTVYVTLEPCLMCAGLMHQARIDRCVFGASDPKAGALGSLYRIHEDSRLNHAFDVESGVRQEECARLLKAFFREKRLRNKVRKLQEKEQNEGML